MDSRDRLKQISLLMTKMHKVMLDSQFNELEKSRGSSLSPGEKLRFLLNAQEFQWLRPLSQLITSIDEVVFQKEQITVTQEKSLLTSVQDLFISESEFFNRYLQVIPILSELKPLNESLKKLL